MLALSGLMNQLNQFSFDQNGNVLCVYADPAYPLRRHLQAPFGGANLTAQEKAYNTSMSRVRVSVEWVFGDVLNQFKFNDLKKKMKVGLSPTGKFYRVSALLTNAHTSLYSNITENIFDLETPILEEYFV